MKIGWMLCVAMAALAFAIPAQAMYKCTDAKGQVVYQQDPCIAGAQTVLNSDGSKQLAAAKKPQDMRNEVVRLCCSTPKRNMGPKTRNVCAR